MDFVFNIFYSFVVTVHVSRIQVCDLFLFRMIMFIEGMNEPLETKHSKTQAGFEPPIPISGRLVNSKLLKKA